MFFPENLKFAVRSEEVKLLQEYLNSHNFSVAKSGAGSAGHETTYFGPKTRAALMLFQQHFAQEILKPLRLNHATGNFYTSTRNFINGLFSPVETQPTTQSIIHRPPPIQTYTIGGTVSGLSGSVVLQNNGDDNLTVNANGSFTFLTPIAEDSIYNVTVLTQPITQTCTITNGSGTMGSANVTNVGVTCMTNTTTLSTSVSDLVLSVTGLTEYGVSGTPNSGAARVITITNTGSYPAMNLAKNYPIWPIGTRATSTCSGTLTASGSCTMTITPGGTATSDGTNPCTVGTAPIPGNISISADNASTVSTHVSVLGYGCIYQGGYVYAFDDTTANTRSVGGKVATTSDQAAAYPNGIIWSSNGQGSSGSDVSDDLLSGIDENSTSFSPSPTYNNFQTFFSSTYANANIYPFPSSLFSSCDGNVDGQCNTNNILAFYSQLITNYNSSGTPPFTLSSGPTPPAYYAAGMCKQTISGYSDWYLPAICEMGYGMSCGTSSSPNLQNMQSSLVDYNGLNLLAGYYWSSTEYSGLPQNLAWSQYFATSSNSDQSFDSKDYLEGVRCSRALTF